MWATHRFHIMVGADIFSEKEENTKEYNKYLQALYTCSAQNAYKTLSRSNPLIPHPYNRKQSTGLPAILSSSFAVWF
jgi:hypothetical protein